MKQNYLTPRSIMSQGMLSVFENADHRGFVTVSFEKKDIKHIKKDKTPFNDLVNHLLRKAFSEDTFLLHRILHENKYYRQCGVTVTWNEDGSVDLRVNLIKMIGLKSGNEEVDLMRILELFHAVKFVMKKYPHYEFMLVLHPECTGMFSTNLKAGYPDEEIITKEIKLMLEDCVHNHTFTELTKSVAIPNGEKIALNENFFFPILGRPHLNHSTTQHS